jgi:hypothetical protein
MTVLDQTGESGRGRVLTVECGSASQAGEPGWRMAAAVRAAHYQLRRGHAEDGGQLLDFLRGEASLPIVAVAFGGAHGGGARPAHQSPSLS